MCRGQPLNIWVQYKFYRARNRPDSATYVRNKKKAVEDVGFKGIEKLFPADATEAEVIVGFFLQNALKNSLKGTLKISSWGHVSLLKLQLLVQNIES